MRKFILSLTLAAAAAALPACGSLSHSGLTMPRNVPVPEDAKNPIRLTVQGATPHQVIEAVARALSSQGIPTYQVAPEDGIAETQWMDMAVWDPTRGVANLPTYERRVLLFYRASESMRTEDGHELGPGLEAWAYYQPNPDRARTRPRTYRETVPTTHYGYTLLLRVQSVINSALRQEGIEFEMVQPKRLGR